MPRPKSSDAVPATPAAPKARGLLGKFFRSTALLQSPTQYLQGQITEAVPPDAYLVQPFASDGSLILGQVLVPAAALFYSTTFHESFKDLLEAVPGKADLSTATKTVDVSAEVREALANREVLAGDSTQGLPVATPPPPAPALKAALVETKPESKAAAPSPAPETKLEPVVATPEAETGPKQRVCRLCGKPGHNARTCPKNKDDAPPVEAAEASKEEEKKGSRWQEPQELINEERDGTPSDEDYEEGNAEDPDPAPPRADIIAALDKLHPLVGTLGVVSVRTGPGTVIIEVNGDTSEVEGILTKTEEGFECCGMPVEFLTFTMEGQDEEEEEEASKEKHADAHPF